MKQNSKGMALVLGIILSACLTMIILFLGYNTPVPIFVTDQNFYKGELLWLYLCIVALVTELFDSRDVKQFITNMIFATIISIAMCQFKLVIDINYSLGRNFWLLVIPGALEAIVSAVLGEKTREYVFSEVQGRVMPKLVAFVLSGTISLVMTFAFLYLGYHTKIPIFTEYRFYQGVHLLAYLMIISTIAEIFDSCDIEQLISNIIIALVICFFMTVCSLNLSLSNTDKRNFWLLFSPGLVEAIVSALMGSTVKSYVFPKKETKAKD